MRPTRRAITLAAFIAVLFCTTNASAQYYANNDRPGLIVSTTTTTSALVGGAIVLTVVSVNKEPTAMLRRYLRHNETAVRAAMATGGGDALRDLAAFFGVTAENHFRAFARLARQERDRWTSLVYADDDVGSFARHVRTAMQFDPRLRAAL